MIKFWLKWLMEHKCPTMEDNGLNLKPIVGLQLSWIILEHNTWSFLKLMMVSNC